MPVTIQQLRAWLQQREHEHLEFKEAKQQLHTERLMKYAAAFANEGGGHLVLDRIFAAAPPSPEFHESARKLVEMGLAETVGQGRGQRLLLARKFYKLLDQPAAYTRKKGLDRETNKALLLKHITDNQRKGSPLSDLRAVLPGHSKDQV